MELNILAEKLDNIQQEELGFTLDEDRLWSQLNTRLGKRAAHARLLLAACVSLIVLLSPLTFLQTTHQDTVYSDGVTQSVTLSDSQEVIPKQVQALPNRKQLSPFLVQRKTPQVTLATLSDMKLINGEKIEPITIAQQSSGVFTHKDISIIQASLEQPKIGKGKKLIIRAQLGTSSNNSKNDYQSIKVKLNAKDK